MNGLLCTAHRRVSFGVNFAMRGIADDSSLQRAAGDRLAELRLQNSLGLGPDVANGVPHGLAAAQRAVCTGEDLRRAG